MQSFSSPKDPTKKRLKKKLFVTRIKIRIHSLNYSISNFSSICGLGEERWTGRSKDESTSIEKEHLHDA
ncbi:uncharacterized protein Bfra_012357 [Botrytis fragariae]|uniref:Uncharacterized protein n=1 Tax=Botrytis fragariae TaxID=1964551 RepID=A0A8H6AIV0_9HELO|nr:uncharacterized protein Bfra_012357 [Botrytis fragariae]KAF5868447.1 hypothetical protein Bfra_012357 [Botrytis fragariae]